MSTYAAVGDRIVQESRFALRISFRLTTTPLPAPVAFLPSFHAGQMSRSESLNNHAEDPSFHSKLGDCGSSVYVLETVHDV